MTKKKFVNGFTSWRETHFEVVSAISVELCKTTPDSELIKDIYAENGRFGLHSLAEKLTNEFEELYKGKEWDGEWFDAIDSFLKEKLYN
jgi:hypothetical protein